jgi:hypothetical protein
MTKHAMKRMKQRVGLKGEQAVNETKKALTFGMGIGDFRDKKQRKYLKKLQSKNTEDKIIKVYNNYVYLFSKDRICITVMELPEYFVKKNVYVGKMLLRHPSKFLRNYIAEDARCALAYYA